ncbi:hypothetical protein L7F22_012453 [Adiantum nelumboides]|nr:hypothetical protein [Adiantum nelumboides]
MMEQGGPAEYGRPPPQNVEHSSSGISSTSSDLSQHSSAAPAACPAPFLFKTYDMVDDATTDAVVSWNPTGTSFVVWDPQHLCLHLLPRYFKHSNFSSFIRQLNIYGFRKSDPDRWEFANRGFVRGQRHLLQGIRRRTPAGAGAGARHSGASSSSLSSSSRDGHQHEISAYVNVGSCHFDAVSQCTTQMQNQLVLVSYGPGLSVLPMDSHCTGSALSEPSIQEEIKMLKREKSLLMMEVMRLRHQLEATEQNLQGMWQRLQAMEQRQQQMLAFFTRAANTNNQAFLANILGQQQHQIRGPLIQPQQIPCQPSIVSAAPAQQASPIASSGIGRPQLSPLVRKTDSLNSSEMKSLGFQLADKACAKFSSCSQKETIRHNNPPHRKDCDLGNEGSSTSNPAGLYPYSLIDAQDHPQLLHGAEFSTFDITRQDDAESSRYNRPQLQFFCPLFHSELPPNISTSCLQDSEPQESKPVLIQRKDGEISDTLYYARQEHAFTGDHAYSYQIITREVSIGASFLQKKNADAGGSAQGANLGDVTVSASNVEPAEAYNYPVVSEVRASQAFGRQHWSAFSLVGSSQNEQAEQFGAPFGVAARIGGASAAPQLADLNRLLSREKLAQQERNDQGLQRVESMMSVPDLSFASTIQSTGLSELNVFENDSTFWEQLLDPVENVQQPDCEALTTAVSAPTARPSSTDQSTRPSSDAASIPRSQDENYPHQGWPQKGS